jgi:sugar/nucleoside kinase (ribokinase family)
LGLGDNVCDIYLHTKVMYPGGQALNVAVFAKRQGARSEYLGVFGRDEVALCVQKTLDELGIAHPRCRQYEGENGFARVNLVEGDRVFMGSNKGGVLQTHPIVLEKEDLSYLAAFDLIHTSNNSFIDGELPKMAALPGLISYDFSLSWKEPGRIEKVAPFIDFGFLSCGGMEWNAVEVLIRQIHAAGCRTVIATMGKEGALLFDGENQIFQPSEKEPAVDSLGAGDGFAAAFLVAAASAKKVVSAIEDASAKKDASKRRDAYAAALAKGASFATEVCGVSGAFGHGAPVPDGLWEKINRLT